MLGLLSQCLSLPVSTMALKMRSGEAELHDCPNLGFSLWSRSKLLPQFTGNVKREVDANSFASSKCSLWPAEINMRSYREVGDL